MKIAFFTGAFPALSETFIINQVIALKNSGHTVHIFAAEKFKGDKIHKAIVESGLLKDTFYLDEMPSSRLSKISMLLRLLMTNPSARNLLKICNGVFKNKSALSMYEFIHYLNKPEYNVLHAHFGMNGNYVAQLRTLGLFKKARFITTFHGYDLHKDFRKNNFYTQLFSDGDVFTVNTKYSRSLLAGLGCPPDKIEVLPVGLNTTEFKKNMKLTNGESCISILFVGRLIELKAPDKVIEICSMLKERNTIKFSAQIIGDGNMLQELEKLIAANGLQEEVTLYGSATQEYIKEAMNNADLFLYPGITYNSSAETQGLVIQEAQAMQLPVLISDAGGMAEGILDGITGYVLPENDLNAFADKIELLAHNVELRKKMGEAGSDFVETRYDSKILNKKLLSLYCGDKNVAN